MILVGDSRTERTEMQRKGVPPGLRWWDLAFVEERSGSPLEKRFPAGTLTESGPTAATLFLQISTKGGDILESDSAAV